MTTKKAERLTENYIVQKVISNVNGVQSTKKELMEKAGFSHASIKSNNPEISKLYTEKSTELINKTGYALFELVDAVEKDIQNGLHLELSLINKIKVLNTLTSVFKGLSPTFKQKETRKDNDGSYKTIWTTLN